MPRCTAQADEQRGEAIRERSILARADGSSGDEGEAGPVRLDQAPTGAPQARVDTDDAHRRHVVMPPLSRDADQADSRSITSSETSKFA